MNATDEKDIHVSHIHRQQNMTSVIIIAAFFSLPTFCSSIFRTIHEAANN